MIFSLITRPSLIRHRPNVFQQWILFPLFFRRMAIFFNFLSDIPSHKRQHHFSQAYLNLLFSIHFRRAYLGWSILVKPRKALLKCNTMRKTYAEMVSVNAILMH